MKYLILKLSMTMHYRIDNSTQIMNVIHYECDGTDVS